MVFQLGRTCKKAANLRGKLKAFPVGHWIGRKGQIPVYSDKTKTRHKTIKHLTGSSSVLLSLTASDSFGLLKTF